MSSTEPTAAAAATEPAAGPVPEQDYLLTEFTARYNSAYPRLVGQIQAITGDAQRAERMVQRAFVRAWRRWRAVRVLDDPIAWVRREALRGRRLGWLSSRRTPARQTEDRGLPAMDPQNRLVLDALLRLPATQRRALVLHQMAGLSVSQVAEDERVAADTMVARLQRGEAALTGLLDDDEHGTGRAPS